MHIDIIFNSDLRYRPHFRHAIQLQHFLRSTIVFFAQFTISAQGKQVHRIKGWGIPGHVTHTTSRI